MFDNGTQTTLHFDLSNSDPRIFSTRNGTTGDPQIVFYNSSVGYEDIKAKSFIVASDASLKNNVTTISNSLEKIQQLRGVSFNWVNEAPTHPKSFGFIAQEVETAAKNVGYDFSGVDAPKNENDLYGLRYAEFVVPIVKAMQEQQKQIEAMQNEIKMLKNK